MVVDTRTGGRAWNRDEKWRRQTNFRNRIWGNGTHSLVYHLHFFHRCFSEIQCSVLFHFGVVLPALLMTN